MVQKPQTLIAREILEEASDWFVDFRVGDVDGAARDRFDRWLRQSPQHIQAYLEIATAYADLPAAKANLALDLDELIARARAAAAPNIVRFTKTPRRGPIGRGTTRRFPLAASVAATVATAGPIGWLAWRSQGVYSTGVAEERSITLADGSIVELSARSRVRVHFSRAERAVDLIEGQALFIVAKNARYPFVVRSGDVLVRDIGTQFDINREVTRTVVTVLEGRIELSTNHAADAGVGPGSLPPPHAAGSSGALRNLQLAKMIGPVPTLVSAGQEVTVDADVASKPQRADLAEATAWRRHQLIFDSSPLVDVVDEFNRYNQRRIVIVSPELEGLEISGLYSSMDPGSFLRFLREQPGIAVTEADGEIRISQRGGN